MLLWYLLHINKLTKRNEPDGIQEAGAEEAEVEIEVEIEIWREKEIQILDGIATGDQIIYSNFKFNLFRNKNLLQPYFWKTIFRKHSYWW